MHHQLLVEIFTGVLLPSNEKRHKKEVHWSACQVVGSWDDPGRNLFESANDQGQYQKDTQTYFNPGSFLYMFVVVAAAAAADVDDDDDDDDGDGDGDDDDDDGDDDEEEEDGLHESTEFVG